MIPPEPPENFKEHHCFYRGVKKFLWRQWEDLDRIRPNFFMKEQARGGLSVDWSKYARPTDTLTYLNNLSQLPNNDLSVYGIAKLNVGNLRRCIEENNFPIKIKHDPQPVEQPDNDAHTLLKNILDVNIALVKAKLAEIADWASGMRPIV